MDIGTHPGFPLRPEHCLCSVIAGTGGNCVILRVVCPKSFEKQLGSPVDSSICTEKGATLESPEPCILPLLLHRLDPQAPQSWLQEAQVTPGLMPSSVESSGQP